MLAAPSLRSALLGRHQAAKLTVSKTRARQSSTVLRSRTLAESTSAKLASTSFSIVSASRFASCVCRRSSMLCAVQRRYASSSKDSEHLQLEGKSDGTVSRLWNKYKLYALGAGGAVAAVSLLGVTASVVAVGGLVSIAGGLYAWYTNRVRRQQSVLRVLIEPIFEARRKEIESFIGPFEYPERSEVAADSAKQKSPTGAVETVIRNVFYLDGKYGKAFVRAMAVENESDGTHTLRKLILDLQDFRRTTAESLVLVNNPPTLEYVDAVSFKGYTLKEYAEEKQAHYERQYNKSKEDLRRKHARRSSPSSKTKKDL